MHHLRILTLALFCTITVPAQAQDKRVKVELPSMMQTHMLANMRDHLLALQTITHLLATRQYEEAADTAERRLGMSSLESHGASHMGPFMPAEMRAIGTNMHRAASRFAISARDAAIDGGLEKSFAALSEVMEHCVACHSGYKVH